jgi:poly(3-hydroxybutyrate) depolymerase
MGSPDPQKVLDSVETSLRIDVNRIYLTGFSMGGYGTWETAIAYPDVFAAIAPICGISDIANARRLENIPISDMSAGPGCTAIRSFFSGSFCTQELTRNDKEPHEAAFLPAIFSAFARMAEIRPSIAALLEM